jgi:hypothetical protein
MAIRFHRSLEVAALDANGITGQRFDLIKQLRVQHTDVVLLFETHLMPHKRFSISNYQVYGTDSHPGLKGGTAVAVMKGKPHTHVDLPPPVSIEAQVSMYRSEQRSFTCPCLETSGPSLK